MKEQNICKFVLAPERERLVTTQFVLESHAEVAAEEIAPTAHSVYLMVSGDGVLTVAGQNYEMTAGTLLFSFAGERVSMRSARSPVYLYIRFDGNRAEELFSRFGITPATRLFSGNEALIPFWLDSLTRAGEANLDLVSESVLLYTFSRLAPVGREGDEVVQRLLQHIEENFTDPDLSLAAVAREWGYHEKYLSHRFKQQTGSGFAAYLRTLRIRHAVFLFERGVVSVKNVALLCGFSDPFYFSKVFKETMGVSPKDYLAKR